MAYCVKQDLIDRYGEAELIQLTDRAGLGLADDAVIEQAITDAAGQIDGYLSGRYQLPLGVVPVALKRAACTIARYWLYDDQATEQVQRQYDGIIKWLEQIAKGTIQLGLSASGGQPEAGGKAQIESGGRVFDRADTGFL